MFRYSVEAGLNRRLYLLDKAPPLLLEGATLFDGRDWVREVSLVVESGTVTQLGPEEMVYAPAEAHRIPMNGKWLLPGLVDCSVHLTAEQPRSCGYADSGSLAIYRAVQGAHRLLARGVVAVACSGGCRTEAIAGLQQTVREGLIAGPTIVNAGREMSLTSAGSGACNRKLDGPEVFRKAIRQSFADGAEMLVLSLTSASRVERVPLSDAELNLIVDEAHRVGARVACRASALLPSKAALKAGVDLLLLGPASPDGECIEMLAAGRTSWAPALSTRSDLGGQRHRLEAALRAVQAEGGAVVVATAWEGSDEYSFAAEAKGLLEAGLPSTGVLAASTIHGAQTLGLEYGPVKLGQRVDLVALDKDPAEDISVLADPEHVSMILHQPVQERDLGKWSGRTFQRLMNEKGSRNGS
jgi:imidazolonepropionase-like amidohydrolase